MTIDSTKVVTSLRAFAKQIGVNWFWSEWDEAGHFELSDSNDHIDDVSLSTWARSGARYLASGFYALPAPVRRERAVRLAASQLDDLAIEAFHECVRQARKNRAKLTKKIRLANLTISDGARDLPVKWIDKLRPRFAEDEPSTTKRPKAPDQLWGVPLSKRRDEAVVDRLYDDLLDALGAPTSIQRTEAACELFFPSWEAARVEATVHPVGMAVLSLSVRASK